MNQLRFPTLCHRTQVSKRRESAWLCLIYTPTPSSGEGRIDNLTKSTCSRVEEISQGNEVPLPKEGASGCWAGKTNRCSLCQVTTSDEYLGRNSSNDRRLDKSLRPIHSLSMYSMSPVISVKSITIFL